MRVGFRGSALRALLSGAAALCIAGSVVAQQEIRQFSSELLLFESRQVLRSTGKPLRYADGDEGAALRRLLDPARTNQVVDGFLEAKRRGETVPDISAQIKPLLERYEAAFGQWPAEYEDEYLDSMHWAVRIMVASSQRPAVPLPGSQEPGLQQLLEGVHALMNSMLGLMERTLREKASTQAFSPAGRQRVEGYARDLAWAREQATPTKTRPVYSGAAVYNMQCAACHATGVALSPRLGDRAEWQRRLRGGFESLVQSTLRGKGAMPPQAGGDLQELELRRAVAFLVNSGGFSIPEPPLPAGHPGVVTERVRPRVAPNPPATQASLGERVYASNCQACHGQGQAQGPFPALVGSRSLQSADATVKIILNGSRTMPPWRSLSDQEIAAVTTYVLEKFGSPAWEVVTPEHVRRLR